MPAEGRALPELGADRGGMATRAPSGTLMSIAAVAELRDVSEKTVRRLVERGELPCLRVGHLLRVDPDELRAWLYHPEVRAR